MTTKKEAKQVSNLQDLESSNLLLKKGLTNVLLALKNPNYTKDDVLKLLVAYMHEVSGRRSYNYKDQVVTVDPSTLTITHIFDGEEVVSGGHDGQIWLATFANRQDAEDFLAIRRLFSRTLKV
jgi:hypothetical protein